ISKPSSSIAPPQKVIRATAPYRSTAPQELSFSKGDFFYVIKEINDHGSWYEAHNPMTGARGIVPRAMFEEFNKGAAPNARTSQSTSPVSSPISSPPLSRASTSGPRSQAFFAIVMHDFQAERTDELDAKAGDPITVVAQSNREWFVAKPIGRLGKPGLIPVSFVQIRDPVTNQAIEDIESIMDSGSLPRVEDWKKQVMNYKATSIPLGTLDDPSSAGARTSTFSSAQTNARPRMSAPPSEASELPVVEETPRPGPPRSDSLAMSPSAALPDGLLLSARVTSFHFENDDYWFRIHAVYQPFDAAGTTSLPPSRDLTLFRAYNDFFDFQTKLLQIFPAEGGQTLPRRRILPYMPGPAERVDSQLSARRREELDEYLMRLSQLNRTTARYVLEHPHVREFFAARPGDLDKGAGPQFEAMSELNWYDPPPEEEYEYDGVETTDEALRGQFQAVELAQGADSDGSDYGDDRSYVNGHSNGNGAPDHAGHGGHLRAPSAAASSRGLQDGKGFAASAYGRDSAYSSTSSGSRWPEAHSHSTHATSPTSSTSTRSTSKRERAPSIPAISASNPAPAFVKIKVFDRVQDDLIALRVHPRGGLAELTEKVQQRLGSTVKTLSYRAGGLGGESYVALHEDGELAAWIEGTDRHVLYAD
ncbi:hypothetical protein K488DRAFT_17084, partial [Vararia minispora EC-137]